MSIKAPWGTQTHPLPPLPWLCDAHTTNAAAAAHSCLPEVPNSVEWEEVCGRTKCCKMTGTITTMNFMSPSHGDRDAWLGWLLQLNCYRCSRRWSHYPPFLCRLCLHWKTQYSFRIVVNIDTKHRSVLPLNNVFAKSVPELSARGGLEKEIPRRWTRAVKARSPVKKVRTENVTAIMYPAAYRRKGKRQLEEKLNICKRSNVFRLSTPLPLRNSMYHLEVKWYHSACTMAVYISYCTGKISRSKSIEI